MVPFVVCCKTIDYYFIAAVDPSDNVLETIEGLYKPAVKKKFDLATHYNSFIEVVSVVSSLLHEFTSVSSTVENKNKVVNYTLLFSITLN
jgi:tetrahydromethanopterin S-methyltransferase subunit D